MREGVHVKGLDDCELVHLQGEVRQGIGTPLSGLAVLLEFSPRCQQRLLLDSASANFDVDRLPIAFLQLGFVVEQVEVRRPAVHEQKDAAFRFGDKVRLLRGQRTLETARRPCGFTLRIFREEPVLIEHGRQRQPGEAGTGFPQEFATGSTAKPRSSEPPVPAVAPFDLAEAKVHQQQWAEYLQVPVEQPNSIGMTMTLVPPGEFEMGGDPPQFLWAAKLFGADDGGKKPGFSKETGFLSPSARGGDRLGADQFQVIDGDGQDLLGVGVGAELLLLLFLGFHLRQNLTLYWPNLDLPDPRCL